MAPSPWLRERRVGSPGPSRWRRPRTWITVALVVAGASAATVLVTRHLVREASRLRVAEANHDLEVCLYGGALPRAEYGEGWRRRHAMEICGGPRFEGRPASCDAQVVALQAAWRELPDDPETAAAREKAGQAFDVFLELRATGEPTDARPSTAAWDVLGDATRALDLPDVSRGEELYCTELETEIPESVQSVLADADLRPPPPSPYLSRGVRLEPGHYLPDQESIRGRDLRLVWPTRKDYVGCWLAPDGEPVARCAARKLQATLVLDHDDGVRDMVLTANVADGSDHWTKWPRSMIAMRSGVIGSTTPLSNPLIPDDPGWAHASGAVTILASDGRGIVHVVSGGATTTSPLPASVGWHRVLPGWAVGITPWKESMRAAHPPRVLYAVPLGESGQPSGPVQELGTMREGSTIVGCRRADGATTLAWLSPIYPERSEPLVFEIGVAMGQSPTSFAPLVVSRIEMFDDRPYVFSFWGETLSCTERGAPRWTFVDRRGVLHGVSCPDGRCVHDDTSQDANGDRFHRNTIVPVGDDEVVEAGTHLDAVPPGSPRMGWLGLRRARLHALATAPTRRLAQARYFETEAERDGRHPADEPYEPEGYASGSWLGFVPHVRRDVVWITGSMGGKLVAIRVRPGEKAELVRLAGP